MICRRHIRTYNGELKDILQAVLHKKQIEGRVNLFEKEFALYIGRKHAIAVSSGRLGLELILEAYGIGKGDEVVFPGYTLKDLVILVINKGIKPVLVDINERTFNMDPALLEDKIGPRTKAIIATHIFGSPCDMKSIMLLAKRHNIIVIEDCAHSLGSQLEGKKTGIFGDAAFFSLELTKSINAYGGGVVVTDDDIMARRIREKIEAFPRVFSKLYQKIFSAYLEKILVKTSVFDMATLMFYFDFSSKIANIVYRSMQKSGRKQYIQFTDLQALIALKKLKIVDELTRARRNKAELLASCINEKIKMQENEKDALANFYFTTIKLKDCGCIRVFRKLLLKNGIDAGIESEIADDCSLILTDNPVPVSCNIYRCLIQLPLYESLTEEKVIRIAESCNCIAEKLSF